MEEALSFVKAKPGLAVAARSRNSRIESTFSNKSKDGKLAGLGVLSEGTRYMNSPSRPNDSRLLARIRKLGQARKRVMASCAQASIKCSQLSSRSRTVFARK